MKKLAIFIFTLVFISSELVGQTAEPSSGVAKNILQFEIETLYSVEKVQLQRTTSWNIPNILIRYGLSEYVELQFRTPFTKERCFVNNELTSNIFKFNEVEIGVSIKLWEQNKLLPKTAIMARIVTPTKSFRYYETGNIISVNFSNQISKKTTLNYNIGSTTNTDRNTTGFYIINISYELNSQVHFFVENSSNFNFKRTESNCLGTGFGINLVNTFSVDFSIAKSMKNNMFYSGAILTWVSNTKKKNKANLL